MATEERHRLVAPKCRHCGRDWTPPQYVSSKQAYCPTCLPERTATAVKANRGVRIIIGLDGTRVVVPDSGGYGLRDAKKA